MRPNAVARAGSLLFLYHTRPQILFHSSPLKLSSSSSKLFLVPVPTSMTPLTTTPSPSLAETLQNLAEKEIFLLDGGTGEELFRRGVPDDRKIWSATAVVHNESHDTLKQVHSSFLEVGARAITTNSYGVVPGVGFTDPQSRFDYISTAGRIARESASQFMQEHHSGNVTSKPVFVLGSLGPLVESYRPDLIREHYIGVQEYFLACQALLPHVDGLLAETMSCLEESLQALEAISMLPDSTRPPLLVSYTLDTYGNLKDGQLVATAITELLEAADQHHVKREYLSV